MTSDDFELWIKSTIESCEKNADYFREKDMVVSLISTEAMSRAYKEALSNFLKITPSPTAETPQNTGGNKGVVVGE